MGKQVIINKGKWYKTITSLIQKDQMHKQQQNKQEN